MTIAIISDIHDNLNKLEKCLIVCKENKVSKIICCGDVCSKDTLKFISTGFPGEIFLVEGNAETYNYKDLDRFTNINFQYLLGYTEIDKLKIGFCHKSKDILKVLNGSKDKLDFIFYGHSHKPWLENKNNTLLINPGNVAGVFYQASFALFNTSTRKLELISIS